MDPKELRIGNYIETPLGGVEVVIDVLCDCVNTATQEGIHYGEVQPIPLTQEWLIKFGFDQDGDLGRWSYRIEDNGDIVFMISALEILNEKPIKYVHSLQNLYFALTGEEL